MKNNELRFSMRSSAIARASALIVLAIAVGGAGRALAAGGSRLPAHFSGLLNDYTPPAGTTGPYEMHGEWSLQLSEAGTATFSAEMTMEIADFANADPTHDPTKLGAHTHHISVTDGVVHDDMTDPINWQTSCVGLKPPVTGGFVVTGTAYVTGNGGTPPFGNPSAVTICIVGGTANAGISTPQAVVEFSNFSLTFASTSLAATHFGSQPINGVVARCERPWSRGSNDCRLVVVD